MSRAVQPASTRAALGRSLAAPIAPLLAASLLIAASGAGADASWQPLEVDVWDPPFNSERQRAPGTYTALDRASRPWRICVSIPHLKDAFWLAVNFAVVDAAKRLGVAVKLYEAGGYDNLEVQRQQISECMASGADGLIVSAITFDGLDDLLAGHAADGKPIVDLINGANPRSITARAAVDYWDNGYQAGTFLNARHGGRDAPLRVAWFPGPEGAGWSAAGDAGFRAAAAEGPIEILASGWGDTGRAAQAKLVEAALEEHPELDVIVGTTVTAEAAVDILRARGLSETTEVMAYYYGPGVHRAIRRGQVLAAPTDKQAIVARIAMDLMARALEGESHPRHVAPRVEVVDRSNVRRFDATTTLPPRGFRPIFSVGDW